MKYVILLTLILIANADNVETPEEINLLGESKAPEPSLDDKSKTL